MFWINMRYTGPEFCICPTFPHINTVKNHSMAEAGRDLWSPSGPDLCSSRDTQSWLPRTLSKWLLKISKEETLQPPWAACASAQSPAQHRSAPGVQRDPPVLQRVPLPLVLALGTIKKSLAPVSLHHPFRCSYTLMSSHTKSPIQKVVTFREL